nr:LysR substrate-binding domain-containing protein [uncultured Moellerella sp.]
MELRQVRQFIAVAEELHFHRAAKRLNMSQPPLTTAIKKLEQEIGTELLNRSNKTLNLTVAGEVFLAQAYILIKQAEHAIRITQETANGIKGHLRFSYVGSALYGKLPTVIRQFRQAHPDITIELLEATTSEQIHYLENNLVDFGILIPPFVSQDDLKSIPFDQDRLAIALPNTHELCQHQNLSVGDLANIPFILWPAAKGSGFYRNVIALCINAGFMPHIVQEAQSMHAVLSLVAAGIGVSIVPASMSNFRNNDIFYSIIEDQQSFFELILCVRYPVTNPAITRFLTFNQENKS